MPRQLLSSLALTYDTTSADRGVSASLEVNNLTNAKLFDFFGVQRPGRFVLAKLTLRI